MEEAARSRVEVIRVSPGNEARRRAPVALFPTRRCTDVRVRLCHHGPRDPCSGGFSFLAFGISLRRVQVL